MLTLLTRTPGFSLYGKLFSANRGPSSEEHRSQDNVTGIALLTELARTLPRTVLDQWVRFAYVGENIRNGSRRFLSQVRRERADKPTLIVKLDSPGLGSELVLTGTERGLEMAAKAATDLWLPHSCRRRWPSWAELRDGDAAITLGSRNHAKLSLKRPCSKARRNSSWK